MDSDLTERLIAAGNEGLAGLSLLALCVEAANEIERLQAQLHDMKKLNDFNFQQGTEAYNKLDALRKRAEGGIIVATEVERVNDNESIVWLVDAALPPEWADKRVRLVVEE
jgi:hypothetical protein